MGTKLAILEREATAHMFREIAKAERGDKQCASDLALCKMAERVGEFQRAVDAERDLQEGVDFEGVSYD